MTSKVIKTYEKLPQDAIDIRNKVFVEEQGFENEFDDMDSSSEHIVIYEKNCSEEKENDMKPIATCRFFLDTDGLYLIGRIAVIKEKNKNFFKNEYFCGKIYKIFIFFIL